MPTRFCKRFSSYNMILCYRLDRSFSPAIPTNGVLVVNKNYCPPLCLTASKSRMAALTETLSESIRPSMGIRM